MKGSCIPTPDTSLYEVDFTVLDSDILEECSTCRYQIEANSVSEAKSLAQSLAEEKYGEVILECVSWHEPDVAGRCCR